MIMLAQLERDMDKGKQAYVVNRGRLAITSEAMAHFELESGQTVSDSMVIEILKFNIENCRRKIDEQVLNADFID